MPRKHSEPPDRSEDTRRSAPTALEGEYEILGELRGSASTETRHLAMRREDQQPVMIVLGSRLQGDENHALAHWASDGQLLANYSNPNVPRVLETRWISNDALAIVMERVRGTSLGEVLSRGREALLPPQRVSAILHVVNGVLDWARSIGVVHRTVTPDNLYFEEGTQRPLITFSATPLGSAGLPDESADVRTIGALAWAMLSGKRTPADAADGELAEARPDLPRKVVEQTEAVRKGGGVSHNDISAFLAVVATAEVLKEGEVAKTKFDADLSDAQLAAQKELDEKRQAFEREIAAERQRLAAEQAALQREAEMQRKRLAAEKAAHDERATKLQRRYDELDARRRALEQNTGPIRSGPRPQSNAGGIAGAAAIGLAAAAAGRAKSSGPKGPDDARIGNNTNDRAAAVVTTAAAGTGAVAGADGDTSNAPSAAAPPPPTPPVGEPVTVREGPFMQHWIIAAVVAAVLLGGLGLLHHMHRAGGPGSSSTLAAGGTVNDTADTMANKRLWDSVGTLHPDSAAGLVVPPAYGTAPGMAPGMPTTPMTAPGMVPGQVMTPGVAAPPVTASPAPVMPSPTQPAATAPRAPLSPTDLPAQTFVPDTTHVAPVAPRRRPRVTPPDTSNDTMALPGVRSSDTTSSNNAGLPPVHAARDTTVRPDSTRRDTTVKKPARRDTTRRDTSVVRDTGTAHAWRR